MREVDRGRHERALLVDLALRAGEAEHHALVAGAFLVATLLLLGIDAHRDVGRLAVQQDLDLCAVIRETILVIADVPHHIARDLTDHLAVDHGVIAEFREQRRLAATLARNDDLVGRAQGLAAEPRVHQAVVGNAQLDVILDECIEDGIGDLVANLVGMTFGHRLRW